MKIYCYVYVERLFIYSCFRTLSGLAPDCGNRGAIDLFAPEDLIFNGAGWFAEISNEIAVEPETSIHPVRTQIEQKNFEDAL